jgi:hypothetical protein
MHTRTCSRTSARRCWRQLWRQSARVCGRRRVRRHAGCEQRHPGIAERGDVGCLLSRRIATGAWRVFACRVRETEQ